MTAVALTLLFFGGMGIGIGSERGVVNGAILTALGVLFAIGGAWR